METEEGRHGQNQGHEPEGTQSTADMTAFVQNLLQQMHTRFQTMSDSIITKIDEMGSRIDELERSIGELTKEMGVEVSQGNALPPSSTQSGTPK